MQSNIKLEAGSYQVNDFHRFIAAGNTINEIDAIRISIASPEQIIQWVRRQCRQTDKEGFCRCIKSKKDQQLCSFGEVKKPETINYRTFKPERDGLFCERIFGPVKDWECSCGKYKRIKYRGIVCEKCGVEVALSKVRRQRMGYIKLAAPVSHIWFFKGTPSRIGNLLDLTLASLTRVLYFQEYIVIDPKNTPLQKKQLLTEDEYQANVDKFGKDAFVAMMGAEAIKILLSEIDCTALAKELFAQMKETTSTQKQKKIIKRLRVVESFRDSGNRPEWMILDVIPVIPPDLRPLVALDGGRFATSDLNDLYRRVINRNNRLRRLMEINAPEVILRNEKRMLQEAVDALFDNGRRGKPIKGQNNRPLKSLSDMLKGKQGRFRQNLLGKRVDYSGRSVIVVGPELKFNQCGLPKKMALELFEPFIIKQLEKIGKANTIKSAKKLIEREDPVVFDVLEEVTKKHPVLLNRAPTLHRLGVQAFEPVLVEGKAIKLHPMVCTAFNADFDGDQMAVHVPLSKEAQIEARDIMLSTYHILSPRDGKPIASPTQDIVLGCYYLTKERPGAKGEGKIFSSFDEAVYAYEHKLVDLHAKIKVRLPDENNPTQRKEWITTVGRILFHLSLPEGISFFSDKPYANCLLNKKKLSMMVGDYCKQYGNQKTAILLDELKSLGFKYATRAGISINIDDLKVPPKKNEILERAKKEVDKVTQDYTRGLVTNTERYNKIIDIWSHATEDVATAMLAELEKVNDGFNSVFMMADSGARGSHLQVRQLAGMRGLMAKPMKKLTGGVGEIIEQPIERNFREGLTVLEYFISTHGARKGLADTALKTADAGYLTRRLVDVAQDVTIIEEDCHTIKGIVVQAIKESTPKGVRVLETLADRVLGRVTLEDVIDPISGNIIVKADTLIDENLAQAIEEANIEAVTIRSVLTCETLRGVCQKCYGADLSTGKLIAIGEAVGIIAAQSIGEPGTQLTLRTFHIGGTAARKLEGWYEASAPGIVKYRNLQTVTNPQNKHVVLNRGGSIVILDSDNKVIQEFRDISYGATISVADGEKVNSGERVVVWDPHNIPIFTDVEGIVRFKDIIEDKTMKKEFDESTGVSNRVIIEHKAELHPEIQILNPANPKEILNSYPLPSGCYLAHESEVDDGKRVYAGQVLARIRKAKTVSRDITGGLPRVAELFEARRPKECALIAEVDGVVELAGISKGTRRIIIKADNGLEYAYNIALNRHVNVRSGEHVTAGERLTDGSVDPHDVLRIQGEKEVQQFLLNEIQEVYRVQGVSINDKHIEIIIRQMMRKVTVDDIGDTRFKFGDEVDKYTFREENARVAKLGGKLADAKPKLLGITKASLETESFISAASFQETTRVLTEAASAGRIDFLRGLKENVIMGRLIPAGTGLPLADKAKYLEAKLKELDRRTPTPSPTISETIQSESEREVEVDVSKS
ncbi:MAG: DNA-directed RNA polymerase subunit beta' [bacterium]|nr:DNA-directed RNA polymerase subunit beta' [bacterium]